MSHQSKLAKAITRILAGSALAAGAPSAFANSTTMYNLTTAGGADFSSNATPCAPCNGGQGTDGWVWGFGTAPSGTTTSAAKWAGTAGLNTTPFGYTGGGVVHWAVGVTAVGDSAEISSQDSFNRYGVAADIDTAKGAWSDVAANAQGWRHDLDFGLFRSDVDTQVRLTVKGVKQTGTNFGFTIFKGMDTSAAAYAHHGAWNALNNTAGYTAASVPGGGTSFQPTDIVAASKGDPDGAGPLTASDLNVIIFQAAAGQVYTIALGGYRNGAWSDTVDGYQLKVEAVPIPAAAWLFGSGVSLFAGIARRRKGHTGQSA